MLGAEDNDYNDNNEVDDDFKNKIQRQVFKNGNGGDGATEHSSRSKNGNISSRRVNSGSGTNSGSMRLSAKEIQSRFSEFGSKSMKNNDRSNIPQLSFRNPENILAWTYTRLVFQHFGERFRARIDAYNGEILAP